MGLLSTSKGPARYLKYKPNYSRLDAQVAVVYVLLQLAAVLVPVHFYIPQMTALFLVIQTQYARAMGVYERVTAGYVLKASALHEQGIYHIFARAVYNLQVSLITYASVYLDSPIMTKLRFALVHHGYISS